MLSIHSFSNKGQCDDACDCNPGCCKITDEEIQAIINETVDPSKYGMINERKHYMYIDPNFG